MKLPARVREAIDDIPWDDIRDMRILVDHVYHRIDPAILWNTLGSDVPEVVERLRAARRDGLL